MSHVSTYPDLEYCISRAVWGEALTREQILGRRDTCLDAALHNPEREEYWFNQALGYEWLANGRKL